MNDTPLDQLSRRLMAAYSSFCKTSLGHSPSNKEQTVFVKSYQSQKALGDCLLAVDALKHRKEAIIVALDLSFDDGNVLSAASLNVMNLRIAFLEYALAFTQEKPNPKVYGTGRELK